MLPKAAFWRLMDVFKLIAMIVFKKDMMKDDSPKIDLSSRL